MKNNKNKIFIALLTVIGLLSIVLATGCERDDICDTENTAITPRLIITFQDFENTEIRKRASGLEISLTSDSERIVPEITTFDSIAIPLNINEDTVSYQFKINAQSDDESIVRENTIEFSYKRTNEYVSKACGFRTTYDELTFTTSAEFDETKNWIRNILIENNTVNEETDAHVRIFH
ncbi:DUF6452 family protein [Aquimarina agarivorans]|uniref:DUF6452 family protein n=1 Tax=Aquimarina agarivorans TaxID=980584 RepID=UPI000248EA16|nr:DUF6452 family protein [Aquimarina agarivorans]